MTVLPACARGQATLREDAKADSAAADLHGSRKLGARPAQSSFLVNSQVCRLSPGGGEGAWRAIRAAPCSRYALL